ncbi:unnamed protein product [Owenia fusiformis]|uniref:VWFA domain-containing protein n=1 Tax=Owenia fusiformis TaxID=6347 RepID=A0A8S4PYY8_OWEFU|nr:unnamed protein product [Owenia fusiformis]
MKRERRDISKMEEIMNVVYLSLILAILHVEARNSRFSDMGKTPDSRCHEKNENYLVEYVAIDPIDKTQCTYYRCADSYYKKTRCPKGTSIGIKYKIKGKKGISQRMMPCTIQADACGDPNEEAQRNMLSERTLRFCGMDLIWVADMSCSIAPDDKERVKKFIMNVIESFRISPIHVRTGGVSYGHEVHNIQTLKEGRNRPITLRNFENMNTDDGKCRTVTNDALRRVRDKYFIEAAGDRPQFPNVLIVITDGKTNQGKKEDNDAFSKETIRLAEEIRKSGAETIVVGLAQKRSGKLTGYEEWLGIAGTEENIYVMESFEQLATKVKVLAEKSCCCNDATEKYMVIPKLFRQPNEDQCEYLRCVNSYYVREQCPKGLAIQDRYLQRKDGQPLQKSKKPSDNYPCRKRSQACRQGNPPIRPDLSFCGMDLMVVIDMSCSISDENKTTVVNFVQDLISKFVISPLHVKIAGISYASKVNNIQTFNEGRNRPITMRNFKRMTREDGRCHTVTDDALEAVRDIYFKEVMGDRPLYKNVLLLLTDGHSYKGKKVDKEMLSNKTIALGAELRKNGVLTIIVGLPKKRKGTLAGMNEWLGIAGDPENILYMNTFDELETKIQLIAEKSCVSLNEV